MKDSIIRRLIMICCMMCALPLVTSAFLGQVQFVWIVFLLVTIPTLMLTAFITVYIKKRMIKPLTILIEKANTISAGDLSRPIVYEKDDEIGHFISSFDRMRHNLHEQQKKQREFEIERKNFINGISHDLKTPIASISAYMEALEDKMAATPEEEKQYFKIIESKLSVLTELSNQLSLSYTTPDTLHLILQEVNCYDWTVDLFKSIKSECQIRGFSPALNNTIHVKENAAMCIDYYQLERAIQNILSNSYRYTKNLLSISTEIDKQNFYLRLENDGVVLDASKTEKIFERFYTEESLDAQGHLGLGLYIAKTIIKSMKGNIRAKVIADKITFEITLPVL
jgi:Signal transduction histidine kinase